MTNAGNSGIIKPDNRQTTILAGIECTVSHENYSFSNGLGTSAKPSQKAIVYTTPENTKFVFPENYDVNRQKMTPEQAIECWYNVPAEVRNKAQKIIEFVDYYNPQDSYWKKIYKNFPNSYATGGKTITFYRYEIEHDNNYVIRTYCHEAGHFIDLNLGVNGQRFSDGEEWENAMKDDEKTSKKKSITEYGENSNKEDFAESIAEYIRDKQSFLATMPKRAEILERILGI